MASAINHVRANYRRVRRTSRNWTVAHQLDAPARTLCGAAVTDHDLVVSDIVRAGKIGPIGRKNLEQHLRCDRCTELVQQMETN